MLNDAVLRQRGDGRFITVAYARLASNGDGGERLTLSTGGHPQPIVLRADGTAEPVGEPGTLLGVVEDPALSDATVDLGPGDALFLYTDGVTEAHAPDRILEAEDVARLLERCARRRRRRARQVHRGRGRRDRHGAARATTSRCSRCASRTASRERRPERRSAGPLAGRPGAPKSHSIMRLSALRLRSTCASRLVNSGRRCSPAAAGRAARTADRRC